MKKSGGIGCASVETVLRSSKDFLIALHLFEHVPPPNELLPTVQVPPPAEEGVLTDDEVRALVRRVAHKRLYFLTDAPRHPQIERLRDLRAEIVAWEGFHSFLFLRSFRKVAFSQNTTRWWAAFLGEAREIYFPPCDRGLWSHPQRAAQAHDPWHHGIDLRVNEDRYIFDWCH
ncbi:MAG: hypothetical protein M3463_21250 [Verrucomicrobiota bacterium]|nr:hypothetical protein [Verrucomicrobiota bacterium]